MTVSNQGLSVFNAPLTVRSILTFHITLRAGANFASTANPFGVSSFSVASSIDYMELSRSGRKADSIGTHLDLLLSPSEMLLSELTLDILFRVYLQLLFFQGDLDGEYY